MDPNDRKNICPCHGDLRKDGSTRLYVLAIFFQIIVINSGNSNGHCIIQHPSSWQYFSNTSHLPSSLPQNYFIVTTHQCGENGLQNFEFFSLLQLVSIPSLSSLDIIFFISLLSTSTQVHISIDKPTLIRLTTTTTNDNTICLLIFNHHTHNI